MKLSLSTSARPVLITVFILLAFLVLLLPSLIIAPFWFKMIENIEHDVELNTNNMHSGLLSQIKSVEELLQPMNSSASNLARVITASLDRSELSFQDIETWVAPAMFQAFSTVPHISQISYIGLEGLFFSYYTENNQTLALYFNSSFPPQKSLINERKNEYIWYTQSVDRDSGELYGEAIATPPLSINTSWVQEVLNSTTGYASLGTAWNGARDPLFLNSASVHGKGAVSLGFPVKAITDFYTRMNLYGGSLSIATNDGVVLAEGLPNTRIVVALDSIFFQLVNPNGETSSQVGYVTCAPDNNGTFNILNVRETVYEVYCSPLEIVGVKSVYALAVPRKGLLSLVQKTRKFALILLALTVTSVMISVFSFLFLMVRIAKREMHLCAALIKQMESTQQAERKSMNKSLAFASASHDIRASLAGITGLIEISYDEVAPGSYLETNLRQMDGCAKDLLSLLNSILDTSKIEAGKMKLEEEEFKLSEFLEDAVDLYHPVGMTKGVEVVLDPYDGSVMKFSHVKGDRGKLKQILCNLLSNAVKFTSEGHISVRAWVQKPSLENSIIASNRNGFLQRFSCLFYKNKAESNDLEAVNSVRNNPNAMEFVFEVSDTGKGIPKEKQKLVFENYVQVKDGQGGTGLGLGIVQSLVRLMGGDIEVVDKGAGEKGACFRFNVFLTVEASAADNAKGDIELGDDFMTGATQQLMGLTISTHRAALPSCTPSPRLNILSASPKVEGSHVVLLIANDERRRTTQTFMQSLGINVSVVDQWENLHSLLKKMKSKLNHSPQSSLGKSDFSSKSDVSTESFKDVPLSTMEGTDYRPPVHRRKGAKFVLILIDATAGPFSELRKAVTEFKKGLQCCCKVVWLDKPTSRSIHLENLEEKKIDLSDDIVLKKPFHGSRLYKVIRLLPEFGGTLPEGFSSKPWRGSSVQVGKAPKDASSSYAKHAYRRSKSGKYPHGGLLIQQAEDSSGSEKSKADISSAAPVQTPSRFKARSSPTLGNPPRQTEIVEEPSSEKPLTGKRILVADDDQLLRKLAKLKLLQLGATVEVCENGEAAFQLVFGGLDDQRKRGAPHILPYDYVLMDCEMPILNGKEATKQIRKVEKQYGVHIPIIALTAHGSGDEAHELILAGMDVHLVKPLNKEHLLEAIRYIHNKEYA